MKKLAGRPVAGAPAKCGEGTSPASAAGANERRTRSASAVVPHAASAWRLRLRSLSPASRTAPVNGKSARINNSNSALQLSPAALQPDGSIPDRVIMRSGHNHHRRGKDRQANQGKKTYKSEERRVGKEWGST